MISVDIAKALDDRGLCVTIYQKSQHWVVWLFCSDDAALGIFQGEGHSLGEAFTNALIRWDGITPPPSIQDVS